MRARYAHTRIHSAEKKHFCTSTAHYYSGLYKQPSCQATRSGVLTDPWPCDRRPTPPVYRGPVQTEGYGSGKRHASVWGRLGTDPRTHQRGIKHGVD